MEDFMPDDMITFELKKKVPEIFIEDLKKKTHFKGIFFVQDEKENFIDFRILAPN